MPLNSFTRPTRLAALLLSLASIAPLQAQTLVSGPGIEINSADIQNELDRAPVEVKAQWSRPDVLQNNLSNIYARRVMAQNAVTQGLHQNPLVIEAIEKAKERILSDAMLENLDQKNQPSLQVLESWASNIYKANNKRFEYAEQVRASHILIRTAEPDAKAKATALLDTLRKGGDFVELAKTNSQDPGSAAKGGDLGYFARGRMVKVFEDTAFALSKAGDVSDVVESPFGFHIIRLDEKKPAGIRPFEEVKDALMREAQNDILNKARFEEKERILKTAKFDTQAIESLAKSLVPLK